jgi:SAM-dependent methyltransferase
MHIDFLSGTPVNPGSLESDHVVTSIYEALLQRAPDSAGLKLYVDQLSAGESLTELLRKFLRSEEFLNISKLPTAPSFPLDGAPPMSIQISFSVAERRAMWDHIAEVWSNFGKTDPFWSVLTEERWRARHMNNEQILTRFYLTGEGEVRRLDAWLKRNGLDLGPEAICAEYGCGVGRITHALARRFHRIVAFDVSKPHLHAAESRLSGQGMKNTQFVLVRDEEDLGRLTGVNLFYSLIVLQHNPPPIIVDILRHAFVGLKPGGIAFFQVPTYSLSYSFSVAQYWENLAKEKTMEMHFLPQKVVLELARDHGVFPLELQPDWCVGHADRWISNTFLMQKCR